MADGVAQRVETVREHLSDERAEQILALWSAHAALTDDAARSRLPEVVCVALDDANEVAGVSSVFDTHLPLLGDRRCWRYRRFAPSANDATHAALVNATFDALDATHVSGGDGPVGLCVVVERPELARKPAAVWPETGLVHAGWIDDANELRVRYFTDALITTPSPNRRTTFPPPERWAEHYPLADEYAFHAFGETDAVREDDVLALWKREGALPDDEDAARRITEVQLVATHRGTLVGVMSGYLQRNAQLRADLWYQRVFVAAEHRNSNVAVHLLARSRERLEQRFVNGEDTRGIGVIAEIENRGIKSQFPQAVWPTQRIVFIGQSPVGAHIYVRYFPGARIV